MLADDTGPRQWRLIHVLEIADPSGRPAIGLGFDHTGSQRLAELSQERRLNSRLAILIDNQVVSAPKIRSSLRDKVEITGSFDQREANQLIDSLRATMAE